MSPIPQHRKCKRRRLHSSSVMGKLVLEADARADVGTLSEDLLSKLCLSKVPKRWDSKDSREDAEIYYVAVSSSTDAGAIEGATWAIMTARVSKTLPQSTIHVSPTSRIIRTLDSTIQDGVSSKLWNVAKGGIDIRIVDVVPLALEAVFVTIEEGSTRRLENGEGIFYEDHPLGKRHIHEKLLVTSEDRLTCAIREALTSLLIVRTGDIFTLPLPPHPITHSLPSPGKVTLCEPVSQGCLSPHCKIIVTRTVTHESIPIKRSLKDIDDQGEDTGNDEFYSAAEEREQTDAGLEDDGSATDMEVEDNISSADSLSDDSLDELITLQAPRISIHDTSGISTVRAGTPQTVVSHCLSSGIKTPGSTFSSYTAGTSRLLDREGRLFKTQGLMQPLLSDLLHPKPSVDDDDENRVYVHTAHLAKIGCFSGDWIQIMTATHPTARALGTSLSGNLTQQGSHQLDLSARPVRVFGLPEAYPEPRGAKVSMKKHSQRKRTSSNSQLSKASSSIAYMSPILLANMQGTAYCRLLPLERVRDTYKPSQTKITCSSRPPFAQELQLSRISTPLSTDRSLQDALFAGLQNYFLCHTRIVRQGDLIAVPMDGELGKIIHHPRNADEQEVNETFSNLNLNRDSNLKKVTGVGWFRVSSIVWNKHLAHSSDVDGIWEGSASIDAQSTRIKQTNNDTSLLPQAISNPWQYYLGLRTGSSRFIGSPFLPVRRKGRFTHLQRRLRELITAATSPLAVHLRIQPLAILLVSTHRNIGKATVISQVCADLGLHTFIVDAYDITADGGNSSDVNTAGVLEGRVEIAMSCGASFCALLIRHIEALTADIMVTTLKSIIAKARIVVATTSEVNKIPDGMRGLFSHEFEMNAPDERDRESILRSVIEDQGIPLALDVDLAAVALKTAALVAGDLVDVVDRAHVARKARLQALIALAGSSDVTATVRDVLIAGGPSSRCITKADFDTGIEAARNNFADAIGAPKIPNVTWDDVGGLHTVKDAVMETIQLPLERPELFAKGMKKRSGILFYGPPGTGKTLLAKAIATEFNLNFFSVKGPELLNMYIGESEANVRRVFQRARDARPCVVFFDELDSVAPKRGNQGDSGGVMDRIVSQLLAELDGMSNGEDGGGDLFIIGATNRPDLLDAALLRPGRFDKMLYLGVSDTHEKQLTIIEALTRKFTLHPSLSLQRVAARLPFTYTGADFYALCSDAMLKAVTRQASRVDARIEELNVTSGKPKLSTAYFFDKYATSEDLAVMVTEEDFIHAERDLVPSVSAKELEHYKRVRAQFEQGEKSNMSEWNAQARELMSSDYGNGNGKGKGKATNHGSIDQHHSKPGVKGNDTKDHQGSGNVNGRLELLNGSAEDDEDVYSN